MQKITGMLKGGVKINGSGFLGSVNYNYAENYRDVEGWC